jgi:hypothetical protein
MPSKAKPTTIASAIRSAIFGKQLGDSVVSLG